jgi:hypothetical protein
MKTIFSSIVLLTSLFLYSSELLSQSNQPKLNQVELFKQFLGSWEMEIAKDTTVLFNFKSYGTGIEGDAKAVSNGVVIGNGKQLWGYDKRIDRFIISYIKEGLDMELLSTWFISNTKFILIPYNNISNPEKAPWVYNCEFKSQDKFEETFTVNNKPIKTDTYTRIKQ